VGHSIGAQIVELAALRRPQSVLGLLLLSPVPLAGAHAPDPIAGALAATGGDVNAQREARRSLMAQPADTKVLEWLTGLGRNVRRDVTEQLVAAWNEGVAEGHGPSAFDGPVLVASGDADPFVTTQMSIDVAGRFLNYSRVQLAGCGHWPQAEHPELVAKLVSDFIVSVSSKPGAWQGRRWLDTRLWRPQREQLRRGLSSFGGF
jgi:esterase